MSDKKFRYFLKADATTYYQVAGGMVSTTTTPTQIVADPMEWRETDLRWTRNTKWSGVFRSFIVPMSFVRDAATILRHICYTQDGYEATCILVIEKRKGKVFEPFYTGGINFKEKHDPPHYFQVQVLDMGLIALMRANDRVPYEIPILESNHIKAYFDGIRLKNTSILTLANDFLATNVWHQMMPTITIQSSESPVQVDVIAQPAQQGLGTDALWQNHPFYKATIAGTVIVDYDISIQVGNPAGSNLSALSFAMVIWQVNAATTAVIATFPLYLNPNSTSYVGLNHAAGSKTIVMQAGEKLVYFAGLSSFNISTGTDAFLVSHTYQYSTLGVHYDLRLPQSIVKGKRQYDVFKELVLAATDGAYTGYSDFLNTPNLSVINSKPWNTILTSGDALRGLGTPSKPAVIKTNLEDFFRDTECNWMTGIGVETIGGVEVMRLEHLSHFYDNSTVIADMGEVVLEDVSFADGYIFKLLKIGTENQDYDNLNGKDEPNTTQIYNFPVIRTKEPLDLVSKYRDDMYGIELTRANLINKKTTDSSSDNDVFVYEVQDNPFALNLPAPYPSGIFYPLQRLQNDPGNSASGLIAADTAFNLGRTPKHKFLRNAPLIHTSLFQQEGKTITFQTTDKNAEVQSKLSAAVGLVVEKANVPVSNLAAPLFLPVYFTFQTKVPTDIPALIASNPYGRINFSVRIKGRTVQFGGFIDEVGIKPADNAVYTWKLLACPDTDLTKLIH